MLKNMKITLKLGVLVGFLGLLSALIGLPAVDKAVDNKELVKF